MDLRRRPRPPGIVVLLLCCLPLVGQPRLADASTRASASSGYYEKALDRFNRSEYRDAFILLKNALQKNPDDIGARLLLGRVYLRLGAASAAEAELRRARVAGADDNLVAVPLAQARLDSARYDEIVKDLRIGGRPNSVQAKLLAIRGRAYMQLHELDKAREDFVRGTRLDPRDPAPMLGIALLDLHDAKTDAADRIVDRALAADPSDANAWYMKGEVRRLRSDPKGAVEYYDHAIRLDPYHIEARIARAASLIDLGRYPGAEEDLKFVRSILPDNPHAAYLYALLLVRKGKTQEAESILFRAQSTLVSRGQDFFLNDAPSLLLAGIIDYAQKHLDDAVFHLRRYLGFEPNDVGARKMLGSALLAQGHPSEALDSMRPALRLAPDDAELLVLLGTAYIRAHEPKAATKMLERAAKLAPDMEGLRTQLALTQLASGQEKTAVKGLEAAFAAGSGSMRAGLFLGLVRLEQGRPDAALAVADAIIKRAPKNAQGYNLRGAAELSKGNPAGARSSFEQALEVDPGFKPARENLARLDLHQGDLKGARRRYQRIVREDPADQRAMSALVDIALRENRPNDAVTWLQKLVARHPEAEAEQLRLLELYLRLRRTDDAHSLIGNLDTRFPDNVRVRMAIGRAYLRLRERDKARVWLRNLSRVPALVAPALVRLAGLQVAADDLPSARWSLEKALVREPGLAPAQAALIGLDVREGKYEKALKGAAALRTAHPKSSLGDVLTGDVLMAMKHYAAAASAYRKGMYKHPSSGLVVKVFRADRAAGDLERGLGVLEAWVKSNPGDLDARRALAAGYLDAGRLEKAKAAHEALAKKLPDDPAIINNLADLYQRLGDPRALAYGERAVKLAPHSPATLDTYGWILVQHGQAKKALPYLREANFRRSDDPRVNYHLGVALSRLDQNGEALRHLEAALRSGQDFAGAKEARALVGRLRGG